MNNKYADLVELLNQLKYDPEIDCYSEMNEVCAKAADAIEFLSAELEKKENGGWIIGRTPTKEECGKYGGTVFLTTVCANSLKTIPMSFCYDVVRGKEMGRWKWYGRLAPWEVIAWKPLPEPYKESEEDAE